MGKGNTPKYGLIYHSSFIGRAAAKNKGRISRYLANKCSMSSRIDCFSDDVTDEYGKKMSEQVEERLEFFNSGKIPRKNVDVMKEAMDLANAGADGEPEKPKKRKAGADDEEEAPKKKKKKSKVVPDEDADGDKKKKKKKKKKDAAEGDEKKKKKKKKKADA